MSASEIEEGRIRWWVKLVSLIVLLLVGGVFLVDFVVLRGDRVAHGTAYLGRDEPARLAIERIGEIHLVEITTRRAAVGQARDQALRFRLVDPEGATVYESAEIVSRTERFFEFTPTIAGEYKLHAEDSSVLLGRSRGLARVAVWVNDRRILARSLPAIPFIRF
jgi:hypothetical protein